MVINLETGYTGYLLTSLKIWDFATAQSAPAEGLPKLLRAAFEKSGAKPGFAMSGVVGGYGGPAFLEARRSRSEGESRTEKEVSWVARHGSVPGD